MVRVLPYVFGILALGFGIFFLAYGIKGGFIDKRILTAYPSTYVTGKEAVTRGIGYVILGALFLAGCLIVVVSLAKKGG